MGSVWLPVAVVASVSSSFFLWMAMTDYERARYFGIIAGLPMSVFAIYGIFAWGQTQKLKK